MQFKYNSKQRYRSIQGLRSFKDTLPTKVKKILKKKGYIFSETLEKGLVGIWLAIFFTNLFGSVFVYFHMRYLFKKKANLALNELT